MFDFKDKVALVTGGASGIGLSYAKALLNEGLKAVAIADIDEKQGTKVEKQLGDQFGHGRALFLQTDVSDKTEFKEALDKVVKVYKSLDILINNAAIANEREWEKMILINVNGVINGIHLALNEYLPKYKVGEEGLIINTSSVAGLTILPGAPVYTATKHAIISLTRSFGTYHHYQRNKVRVLAILPGFTRTKLFRTEATKTLGLIIDGLQTQDADHVAKQLIPIIGNGKNGSLWVVEGGQPAYEVEIPARDDMKVKCEILK